MPKMPPRPCNTPRCKNMAVSGGRCDEHQPKPWFQTKSSSDRGYGAKWRKLRDQRLKLDSYMCQVCLKVGIYTKADAVDHIIPKSQGGTDSITNLQSICNSCHTSKTQLESGVGRNGHI